MFFLVDDLFEGCDMGFCGYEIVVLYIVIEFVKYGLKLVGIDGYM